MYCSSCGFECAAGLSYCNRCGATLTQTAITTQVIHVGNLTKPVITLGLTMLGLTLGGFAMIFVTAGQLARNSVNADAVGLTIVFGMATILVTDILLARLLSRIINSMLEPKPLAASKPQPAQFAPAERTARQVAAAPPDYGMPSVTEHTTRTLTPSYKEPNG
jgi:hypothetical protein